MLQTNKKNSSKGELIKILSRSTSSTREKNQAIKQLKKFTAQPKKDLDNNLNKLSFNMKHGRLFHFMCYRCDKPKQSNVQIICTFNDLKLTICQSCHMSLERDIKLKQIISSG
ncbi:uncharacterized protein CMU_011270 [Cryptosporidium muris RN66]|uniref:Uncharacterized protein n=1 Tax=Cryptosporidium muris (strain RN66) TaxID=441375 RepID=B6AIY7_CRYMR|nr:uncharacterized protein CMU_011270 [Cryptosporidium muris RN66]EEA08178.1 hypothetical protein, conserved [Cryptosporidium muris RN66]|eukprot:XP_002142527.1 hypothetical protein [Cryptosporidium muris RN66]